MTPEDIQKTKQELEAQKLLNEARIQNLIKENEQIAVLIHIAESGLKLEKVLQS